MFKQADEYEQTAYENTVNLGTTLNGFDWNFDINTLRPTNSSEIGRDDFATLTVNELPRSNTQTSDHSIEELGLDSFNESVAFGFSSPSGTSHSALEQEQPSFGSLKNMSSPRSISLSENLETICGIEEISRSDSPISYSSKKSFVLAPNNIGDISDENLFRSLNFDSLNLGIDKLNKGFIESLDRRLLIPPKDSSEELDYFRSKYSIYTETDVRHFKKLLLLLNNTGTPEIIEPEDYVDNKVKLMETISFCDDSLSRLCDLFSFLTMKAVSQTEK